MSRPDVDDVINYLSIKFNKIFCDRDFVCCVIADLERILDRKDQTCVLVFPTLGPIYLKALRYQARIFDLAVFNITSPSGKFKSLALCHKDHIKKVTPIKEAMADSTSSKRKRPERQLYVPPAQRATRLSSTKQKVTPVKIHQDSPKIKEKQCSSDNESVLLTLSDVVSLYYFFKPFMCSFQNSTNCYKHQSCEFKRLLEFKLKYNYLIKLYNNCHELNNVFWKINFNCTNRLTDHNYKTYPFFNFETIDDTADKPPAVLVNNQLSDFGKCVQEIQEYETSVYRIECDKICDSEDNYILDLSVLESGHFFIISVEEEDYFYECQEKHDADICYANMKKQLEISKQLERLNLSAIKTENEQTNHQRSDPDKTETNETPKNNSDIVKNKINNNKKKVSDNKHEQEKEIMRMTKEYINRKTRPIMKYVDDSNDTLQIDKSDSVNNWEDLFDDDGQIQEDLLTEVNIDCQKFVKSLNFEDRQNFIVDKVGDDITIVKASEDYTAYTNKPPEDLEHVVELYNFPATLETHDLVQAFSDINSDAMYIKWVDDTHALLVLGSLSQAQKAISMRNPLIKVRPMTAASAMSMDVANKSDLKPAMKRPPTNLQTARRLITSHLGTKSKLTKEQIAKEKQDLKNAREMKRLIKQNEKDAWEGNIRSSFN